MNPPAEPDPVTPSPTSSPSPTPAPSATCSPSGLTLTAGPVDAAMGLRAVTLRLTSCAQATVTVEGYPLVTVLDADHEPLAVTTSRGTGGTVADPGPSTLLLEPGQSAVSVLSWRSTVTSGDIQTGELLSVSALPGEAAQELVMTVDVGTTGSIDQTAWYLEETP